MKRLSFRVLTFTMFFAPVCTTAGGLIVTTDPLTRYCHIKYHFPFEAPLTACIQIFLLGFLLFMCYK